MKRISVSYSDFFSFIWKFIRLQSTSFFFILIASLVWSLDQTLWPYLLRLVIDIFTQYDLQRAAAWTDLKIPIISGLIFWITVDLGFRCQGYLMAKTMPKLDANIRIDMFDHIQRHSPTYFAQRYPGGLSNKISDMITSVSSIISNLLTLFIPSAIALLLALIFFINIHPLLALATGVWSIIHVLVGVYFTKHYDEYERSYGEARTYLLGKIVDSFSNNFAINLFFRFDHERSYISQVQKEETDKNFAAKRYVEIFRFCLGVSTFLGAGLLVHGLMIYLWMHGELTTGEVTQVFNTTWNIISVMWLTSSSIPGLFQSIGLGREASTVMKEPQDIADTKEATPLVVTKGEIIFENVSFYYGQKKLFHNKDVHIRPGEKIGLVGASGSGKSTFVNLILRFFDIQQGHITIDGRDIKNVTLESLRSQVALIPQEPMLFHRSFRENIRFGRLSATDEEVYQAARQAHCDEFIKTMPRGYDTVLGEQGSKISGGEKQRIAIARAILANTPILILDEATSALDSVTEQYIQESMEQLMQGRTTIAIAHRLSTLSKMDRILVLNKGRVIEEGSHDTLLQLKGHYATMWHMQAGGFITD